MCEGVFRDVALIHFKTIYASDGISCPNPVSISVGVTEYIFTSRYVACSSIFITSTALPVINIIFGEIGIVEINPNVVIICLDFIKVFQIKFKNDVLTMSTTINRFEYTLRNGIVRNFLPSIMITAEIALCTCLNINKEVAMPELIT